MIHVGTAADVTSCMMDGWQLVGIKATAPGKRGYIYWLQPPQSSPYGVKRVSTKIIAALEESGQVSGYMTAYGDLRYRLGGEQGELLAGA